MINTLIFDLDGVIVNTEIYHYRAWLEIADELNVPFNESINEQLKGVGRAECLDILLDDKIHLSPSEFRSVLDKKNSLYLDHIEELSQDNILPGVISLLNEAKSKDFKIAIGSSSKNANVIINKAGIAQYFNSIIDGNCIEETKPNPEVFLKAASSLNAKPSECIVFEDAASGIEAALNANMLCIGVGHNIPASAHFTVKSLEHINLQNILKLTSSLKHSKDNSVLVNNS